MVIKHADYATHGIIITIPDEDCFAPARAKIEAAKVHNGEDVAYDFHLGARAFKPGDESPVSIVKGLKIKPGTCMRIETAEHVTTPNNVYGVICSRYKVSSMGLLVTNAKVDPVFGHHLNLVIFNTTKRTISLDAGSAFCSVHFMKLQGTVDRRQSKTVPHLDIKRTLYSRIEPHIPQIITILISITGAIAAAVSVNYINKQYAQSNQPPPSMTKPATP